jgi:hypothetical protein
LYAAGTAASPARPTRDGGACGGRPGVPASGARFVPGEQLSDLEVTPAIVRFSPIWGDEARKPVPPRDPNRRIVMSMPIARPSPRAQARRDRRTRPAVEGLEGRQTPTGLALGSSLSLVLLNPQPLPPGSSPTAIYYPPSPVAYWPPGPI